MGTQGTQGRKRGSNKERSTAEDDALNLIAREAEARLAAKRAARAEAREIRMKELERQQKELSDDDERMSVGSRSSVRSDGDYVEKGSRSASALTAGTLASLGGSSSRRGSVDTAIDVDAETSLREIKEIHELKDQIQDVETKYMQNLKEAKDALVEVDEKYRKAMVSNAQLDNEKNNLMYQVDTLKDSLMELEELLAESRREYDDKVKEHEREKQAHSTLQFQYNKLQDTIKQSEEMLNEIRQLKLKQDGFNNEISDLQETIEWKDKKIGALERQKEYTDAIRVERDELRDEVVQLKDILKKHGIVLGPDLNINGGVEEIDGQTQNSPTSPAEGNSVLGRGQEPQLGSSGAEKLDAQHQEETSEEPKESPPLSSTAPCGLAVASGGEASDGECQTNVCSVRDGAEDEGTLLTKDSDEDIPIAVSEVVIANTEEKDTSAEVNGVASTEKGDLVDMCVPDTKAKTVTVAGVEPLVGETITDIGQMAQRDLVEPVKSTPTVMTENTANANVTDNLVIPVTSARTRVDSESAEDEGGHEEPNETSSSSANKPQGAGKKKRKKKKKGKKKKSEHREENDGGKHSQGMEEKSVPEKIESVTPKENATESSPFESRNEPEMDQRANEQDGQEVEAGVSLQSPNEESSVCDTDLAGQSKGSISAGNENATCCVHDSVENFKGGAESPGETNAFNAEIGDGSKDESVPLTETNSEHLADNQVNGTEASSGTENVDSHHQEETFKEPKESPLPSSTAPCSLADVSGGEASDKEQRINKCSVTDGVEEEGTLLKKDSDEDVPVMDTQNTADTVSEVVQVTATPEEKDTSTDNDNVVESTEKGDLVDTGDTETKTKNVTVAKEEELHDAHDAESSPVQSDAVSSSENVENNFHLPSKTSTLIDCVDSLPDSKDPLESDQTTATMADTKDHGEDHSDNKDQSDIQSSVEGVLEVKEMVDKEGEPTLQTEANSLPSNDGNDGDHSVLSQEENGKDPVLDTGFMEPENGPHESSVNSCNVSLDQQCGSDVAMSLDVDHASGPTGLSMPVLIVTDVDSETVNVDTTDTSDLAKETSKTGSCSQESAEDFDEEGEECLSFDFDDLDVAENDVPSKNEAAEHETDLEVTPVEVNNANTELDQGDAIPSQEEVQLPVTGLEEPAESDQEKPVVHNVLDEDHDSASQDPQASSAIEAVLVEKGENDGEEENAIEAKDSGTDVPEHISDNGPDNDEPPRASEDPANGSGEPTHSSEEPGNGSEKRSGIATEPCVVETNSVKEGEKEEVALVGKNDAVEVVQQDQETKKDTPPPTKDSKKNAKKGKSKGKEGDCKMS